MLEEARLRAKILSRKNVMAGPSLDRDSGPEGPYYQAGKSSTENWELGLAVWGSATKAAASEFLLPEPDSPPGSGGKWDVHCTERKRALCAS